MEITYVFGHKKPDTDSVTSAISLSYLKNQLGNNTEPRVLGDINNETKFALNYFNTEQPKYLNDVKLQIKDLNYRRGYFISNKESIKSSFEENALETAVNLLIADPEEAQQFYDSAQELNTRFNILETPVYWNIEDIDSENFILEVCIGKYKIQPGDCLSILAKRFGTTVEQLIESNPKITDPDLIYAGDTLAIAIDF